MDFRQEYHEKLTRMFERCAQDRENLEAMQDGIGFNCEHLVLSDGVFEGIDNEFELISQAPRGKIVTTLIEEENGNFLTSEILSEVKGDKINLQYNAVRHECRGLEVRIVGQENYTMLGQNTRCVDECEFITQSLIKFEEMGKISEGFNQRLIQVEPKIKDIQGDLHQVVKEKMKQLDETGGIVESTSLEVEALGNFPSVGVKQLGDRNLDRLFKTFDVSVAKILISVGVKSPKCNCYLLATHEIPGEFRRSDTDQGQNFDSNFYPYAQKQSISNRIRPYAFRKRIYMLGVSFFIACGQCQIVIKDGEKNITDDRLKVIKIQFLDTKEDLTVVNVLDHSLQFGSAEFRYAINLMLIEILRAMDDLDVGLHAELSKMSVSGFRRACAVYARYRTPELVELKDRLTELVKRVEEIGQAQQVLEMPLLHVHQIMRFGDRRFKYVRERTKEEDLGEGMSSMIRPKGCDPTKPKIRIRIKENGVWVGHGIQKSSIDEFRD